MDHLLSLAIAMMTAHRPAFEEANRLLEESGFNKKSDQIFTIELMPGILGWLGLNRATKRRPPGEVEINPVVGVRFQEVESLIAELRCEKSHPYQPPTLSSPLGYLMPEARYRGWVLDPNRGVDTAREMVNAVESYGLPFMRSLVDLGSLCRRLDAESKNNQQLMPRRLVAWLLAGDLDRVRRLLGDALATLGSRTDLAALDFREFAGRLQKRLLASS